LGIACACERVWNILHDWDEEKATRILGNVHRAMASGGNVLVVESVIPPGNGPSFGKLLDLAMLVMPGGQERTEEAYPRLYEGAAFRLTRIVPPQAPVGVIEGKKDYPTETDDEDAVDAAPWGRSPVRRGPGR
jgi:hypothetical protein